MKNTDPLFEVVTENNIIEVKLSGIWTVQADLAYLTTLIEHIHKAKGKPWSILIDMRGWDLPLDVFNSEFKTKISLDRRNQIAESWLVDDLNQAEMLMYFFEQVKIKPKRFLTRQQAMDWINKAKKN